MKTTLKAKAKVLPEPQWPIGCADLHFNSPHLVRHHSRSRKSTDKGLMCHVECLLASSLCRYQFILLLNKEIMEIKSMLKTAVHCLIIQKYVKIDRNVKDLSECTKWLTDLLWTYRGKEDFVLTSLLASSGCERRHSHTHTHAGLSK